MTGVEKFEAMMRALRETLPPLTSLELIRMSASDRQERKLREETLRDMEIFWIKHRGDL